MTSKIKLKVLLSTLMLALQYEYLLIVFNMPEHGHSNGVFKKQQFLHSQKLRTVVGQKYHPEWYFLTHPAQTMPGFKNQLMFPDVTV